MYKIGDIFYLDDEYSNRAKFCNDNGLMIKEIEADKNGRRFQIQEIPKPTEKELVQQEIQELNQKLLDTDYIANKLAEAVSKCIATGDNTEVIELRTKYSKQLEDRQLWRDRIKELQV